MKAMPRKESMQKPRAKSQPTEIVSVDEAVDLYRGEWILMRVTRFDEKREPLAGVVVAHARSHGRVFTKLSKEMEAKEPRASYYIFLGEPRGRTGEDLRKQLEELAAEEGTVRARRQ
jgi:hypothetical protein